MFVFSSALRKIVPRHSCELRIQPLPLIPLIGKNWIFRSRLFTCGLSLQSVARSQFFRDATVKLFVCGKLISDFPENRRVNISANVNVRFEIFTQAATGEVGAPDNCLSRLACLEIVYLRMKAPMSVFRDKGVGHVHQLVN